MQAPYSWCILFIALFGRLFLHLARFEAGSSVGLLQVKLSSLCVDAAFRLSRSDFSYSDGLEAASH